MQDEVQKAGLKASLDIRAAHYLQATRVRRLIQEQVRQFFAQVDVVVCFTESSSAPRIDNEPSDHPKGGHPQPPPPGNTDLMAASNLTGLPGVTIPCGFTTDTKLPVGLHLVGRSFDDMVVIALGREFQKRTDWHTRRPLLAQNSAQAAPAN
jgi:aspartyl-tRNA(Asn)/glutamyl-tRNA(Gln) amidotransferase subunit A